MNSSYGPGKHAFHTWKLALLQELVPGHGNGTSETRFHAAAVSNLDKGVVRTHHGVVLLLQRRGIDDASQEASVADGMLLPLVALIQQLVVQQEQLATQRVELVQRSGA